MISVKTLPLVIIMLATNLSGSAQLKTARIFGDHMVLQRNKPIAIWGWDRPGTIIKLSIDQKSKSTRTDNLGKWMIYVDPMKAGGPYDMVISSDREHVQYTDIMIGEVWICSGQSNMEFELRSAVNYKNELTNNDVQVRQFAVKKQVSLKEKQDLEDGRWEVGTKETKGAFSAVGYFFARDLSEKLHVTVGLINNSWGGSQAEGWISKEGMLSSPDFKQYAEQLPSTWEEADARRDKRVKAFAYRNSEVVFYKPEEIAPHDKAFFDTWFTGFAPGSWDWEGQFLSYRGNGFMQKTVFMDDSAFNKESFLRLGDKDGYAEVYINGKAIFKNQLINDPVISIPSKTWKMGENNLFLFLSSQKDITWYGPGIPGNKEDLYIKFNDTTLNIADSYWKIMPDFSQKYFYERLNNSVGTTIYNSMLYPLVPYTIAGVIWYQGETNAGRSVQYRSTFPLLITDWRAKWHEDFPFLFVQLSSLGNMQSSNQGSGWAELREAQLMTLKLPKTGMAVTIDVGNPDDVHPKNKEPVGYRLSAIALHNVYGIEVPYSGPMYDTVLFRDNTAIISFKYSDSGFEIRDKYKYLKGFEMAGPDRKFYYAQAKIENGQVIVWSEDVQHPVAVRYGWTNAPIDANLYSKDGFPASPFRTDNWKEVTAKDTFQ